MDEESPLHLFEGFGIEMEFMIVSRDGLDVMPVADELLRQVGGGYEMEVERGDIAWSNELALHVIELKTNGPAPNLSGLSTRFQDHVQQVEALLEPLGARLLPTAMHPWMNPERELKLWPHEDRRIYNTFDRIFDCRGHGWSNLQSTHINLPFANDDEFARLHAAMRLVLPLVPAIAASSPFVDGRSSGMMDTRVFMYRHNADRVPSVTGHVIPERVFSMDAYREGILKRIYRELAPLDPQGIIQHEWVNARGCIARFDRMALEIRLLDIQECPFADMAIVAAIVAVIQALVEERWSGLAEQQAWDERALLKVLESTWQDADHAMVTNPRYAAQFGFPSPGPVRARDLWQHVIESVFTSQPEHHAWRAALELFVRRGCLARRILEATGQAPSPARLRVVYKEVAECLRSGALFDP